MSRDETMRTGRAPGARGSRDVVWVVLMARPLAQECPDHVIAITMPASGNLPAVPVVRWSGEGCTLRGHSVRHRGQAIQGCSLSQSRLENGGVQDTLTSAASGCRL